MMRKIGGILLLFGLVLATTACRSGPEIQYYQLVPRERPMAEEDRGDAVLSIEQLVGDAALEDPRIVYRVSPYRLDYYYYHRWTSPPGVMLSDFLRVAYENTGYFSSVVSGFSPEAPVFLNGRIVALEEVDNDDGSWTARVVVELRLRSARTGDIVWSATMTEEEPVVEQTPEGLAKAMSVAVGRIVSQTAPEFAAIAGRLEDRKKREKQRDKVLEGIAPEQPKSQ